MAGRLLVHPSLADPGTTLTTRIRNLGEVPIHHGACPGAQRRIEAGWIDANRLLFGRFAGYCIAILYTAEPGELGPKLGGRAHGVSLPPDLPRGRYRLTIDAYSGRPGHPEHRVTLTAPFTMR